ncbi:MAG: transporter substrate-binding domain-containing protein [Oceanospirillaceae bacterium]|nr:transporter substrate-binding domain-containing protein [Oceanospirillaceae bacterium]
MNRLLLRCFITAKSYLIIICLLLFSSLSYAGNCMSFRVIKNAPIGYLNDQGVPTGTHWDYLQAISERSGLCINLKLLPYARLWRSLETGTIDGAIIFRSDDRQHIVNYVSKIRSLKTVVIPSNNVKLTDYRDLTKIIIGKTRGTRLNDTFDMDKNLNVISLNGYKQAAGMLGAGRLDAIAGSGVVLTYQLNLYGGIENVNIAGRLVLGSREQWLQLSKTSPHQDKIPLLQQAITELSEEGVFDKIMDKHYGDSWRIVNQ